MARIVKMKVDGKKETKKPKDWDEEEKRNIVGLFELLLKVDKRIHPENYKKIEKQNDTTPKI